MGTRISPLSDVAYALLRIVAGSMFLVHGVQKIFGVLSEHPKPEFGSQPWIGGVIELVCGALIALGLFTSPAAFLASGTMAVAYIQFHWKFQMGANFIPTINKGELAVLYCFVFLYFVTRGSGVWSVDAARRRPSRGF
ncbi:MAG: DoxX family protein [Planctomycetota bacterium]